MEVFVFKDLLIIFSLSILVLLVGHRFHIPPVVGFLITGVLCGPHGLQLVSRIDDVELLAQIGIVLLLFSVGMEFSFKKLIKIKRLFLLGGSLQVGLTVAAGFIIGYFIMNSSWRESIFLGCLLSLSSTAIILRLLEQKGETSSPHGRLSVSILIFQDMVAIPMILLIPLLAGVSAVSHGQEESVAWLLAKGIVILAFVFISAERIVTRLLLLVARTRSRELFLLSVLALCFGVAWLTSSLGLSLTIGAFLAGLIISESEYSNEAIGDLFPFQALFISFFFVSIGMLLNLNFVLQEPLLILTLALGILLLKTVTAGLTTLLLGMPIRTAILVGITLSQVGEFSFVLAKTGLPYGLGSEYHYQLFLAVALITMGVAPVLINFAPQIANWISLLPIPERVKTGIKPHGESAHQSLESHVIIVGFGISGRNLARSSKVAGIPYTILEMNPDTVKDFKQQGEPIHFGDATHMTVLEHAAIQQAKAVAVVVNDPIAAKRIVKIAREINPSIYIIVRTRYVQEMPLMLKLGADEVIPDEFGTSIEIFSRVLKQYHIPTEEIDKFVEEIRADGYELLRNRQVQPTHLSDIKMNLLNVEISSFRVHPNSPLVGKTLMESHLRKNHGLTVLLIRRDNNVLPNPDPDTQFIANDIIVVVGEKGLLAQAHQLFNPVKTIII
jgi:monovalent cation:H+ antiporter-2, CPA2 family